MQWRTVLLIGSDECGWADLRLALDEIAGLQVVGEATDALRGVELAIRLQPDVIVAATELGGAPLMPSLLDLHRAARIESKIIVFAANVSPQLFVAIDDVRITSYLLWPGLSSETLRHCLAAALDGDVVVVSRSVAESFIETQRRAPQEITTPVQLTKRERIVIAHMARGHYRHEIADAECIGLRTVERTIAGLERKLDAPTPFTLGMKVAQLGLLDRSC